MTMLIDRRPADIELVDEIWRGESAGRGSFVSVAATHWELVVTQARDWWIAVTLRGSEMHASTCCYDGGGRWCGIRFRLGSHLAHIPILALLNSAVSLPVSGNRSFMLHGIQVPM